MSLTTTIRRPMFADRTARPSSRAHAVVVDAVLIVAGVALAERALGRNPAFAFIGFIGASIVPFLIGVPYLALILGAVMGQDVTWRLVMHAGVLPCIVPGLIEAAIAALIIPGAWLLVRAADRAKRSCHDRDRRKDRT